MNKKKIIAAGGLVTNDKKELLIMFRRGKWDLPKGKLDEGESIESCAIREVEEETGLTKLELKNFVGLTYHEYFDKYSSADVVKETHWFGMHVNGETKLVPQTEEDIEKIIWANEEKLKECLSNTYSTIAEIIEKFKKQNHT
jgi:8-oxo-dGTP pyrophosphatase MutT (NUDIX family)